MPINQVILLYWILRAKGGGERREKGNLIDAV